MRISRIQYGQEENIDIYAKLTPEVMDGVIAGRDDIPESLYDRRDDCEGQF